MPHKIRSLRFTKGMDALPLRHPRSPILLDWASERGGVVASYVASASAKECRMEQQCHWKNFKKYCVWVRVCH